MPVLLQASTEVLSVSLYCLQMLRCFHDLFFFFIFLIKYICFYSKIFLGILLRYNLDSAPVLLYFISLNPHKEGSTVSNY